MKKKIRFSALIALACVIATPAFAQVVTYTLEYTPTAGTYEVFAEVSVGDNFGLVTYGIPLTGSILTVAHVSPNRTLTPDFSAFNPSGFSTLRSAADDLSIAAGQQTIPATPWLVPGFGQVGSSFAAEFPGVTVLGAGPDSWDAKLLIATGTFSGDGSDLGINDGIGAFTSAVWTQADFSLSAPAATTLAVVVNTEFVIPEPATLALGLMGLVGLVSLRRRSIC